MIVVAFSALAGLLLVLLVLLDWRAKVKSVVRTKGERKEGTYEPPVLPYTVPWLGHAMAINGHAEDLFRRAMKHFSFGAQFQLYLIGIPIYVITNPKDVLEIFRRANYLTFTHVLPFILHRICGTSKAGTEVLFTGEFDKNGNKVGPSSFETAHPFFSTRLASGPPVALVAEPITHEINRMVHTAFHETLDLQKDRIVAPDVYDVDALGWCRRSIANPSVNSIFGPRLLKLEPKILDYLFEWELGIAKLGAGYPRFLAPKTYAARDKVRDAMAEWIATRNEEGNKVGAMFIREAVEHLCGKPLSEHDRASVMFGIFLATQFNAANIAFWLLTNIAAQPELMEQLRDETAKAFNDGVPDIEILLECELLQASINEALRLYAASPSVRVAAHPTSLSSGLTLNVDDIIIAPIRQAHLREEFWGPEPEKFAPQRFIDKPKRAKEPFFRPFGGGDSLCSGKWLAQRELSIWTAEMIRAFDIELKGRVPAANEGRNGGGVLGPIGEAKGVRLRLSKRA